MPLPHLLVPDKVTLEDGVQNKGPRAQRAEKGLWKSYQSLP